MINVHTTLPQAVLWWLIACVGGGIVSGLCRGFFGQGAKDVRLMIYRRRRRIEVHLNKDTGVATIEFPPAATKDELRVVQAAIEQSNREIFSVLEPEQSEEK